MSKSWFELTLCDSFHVHMYMYNELISRALSVYESPLLCDSNR